MNTRTPNTLKFTTMCGDVLYVSPWNLEAMLDKEGLELPGVDFVDYLHEDSASEFIENCRYNRTEMSMMHVRGMSSRAIRIESNVWLDGYFLREWDNFASPMANVRTYIDSLNTRLRTHPKEFYNKNLVRAVAVMAESRNLLLLSGDPATAGHTMVLWSWRYMFPEDRNKYARQLPV